MHKMLADGSALSCLCSPKNLNPIHLFMVTNPTNQSEREEKVFPVNSEPCLD